MSVDFRVVVAGHDTARIDALKAWLESTVARDVRRHGETFDIATELPTESALRTVVVVFCGARALSEELLGFLKASRAGAVAIFPVVANLADFTVQVPYFLQGINGFELPEVLGSPAAGVADLGSLVIESLGLMRARRKIFISYVRAESRGVALQLAEALPRRWYQVFLDTQSIAPGAEFQARLLEELTDSDMLILLGTADVPNRPWVQVEIEAAVEAALGGLEVVWPHARALPEAAFLEQLALTENTFDVASGMPDSTLTQPALNVLLNRIADVRFKALAFRENALVEHVQFHARAQRWHATLRRGRYVLLSKPGYQAIHLTTEVGVPDSRRFEAAVRIAEQESAAPRILLDPTRLQVSTRHHLNFLERRLDCPLVDFRTADGLMA
ncbi:MAG: toll/interleukin-1 receptor domain-containing protein [Pseudomonadota bacterium]